MHIRAFRHWTPKYLYNRFKLYLYEIKHPNYPWLTQHANAILSSCLRITDVGLEWGSGRSTIWLAKRVAHLTSVEHNPAWYEKIGKKITKLNITNIELFLFRIQHPKYEEVGKSQYVRIVDRFPSNSVDFVLIDGLFRSECALRVLSKIKSGGILVIDNINLFLPSTSSAPHSRTWQTGPSSKRWQLFAELVSEWRCIWTSNGVSDTALWVKPAS